MKFTLTYDGELRPNSRPDHKWEIRKQFHPKLETLWNISTPLHMLKLRRYIPEGGYYLIESHHKGDSADNIQNDSIKNNPHIDLCAPISSCLSADYVQISTYLVLTCVIRST